MTKDQKLVFQCGINVAIVFFYFTVVICFDSRFAGNNWAYGGLYLFEKLLLLEATLVIVFFWLTGISHAFIQKSRKLLFLIALLWPVSFVYLFNHYGQQQLATTPTA